MFGKTALLAFALMGTTFAVSAEESAPQKPLKNSEAAGHEILVRNCSRCHSIESEGKSPLAEAPPFHDVMKRYDPSELEEALAEGIMTGHNEMPQFTFEPDQITDIIAYLDTLRPK